MHSVLGGFCDDLHANLLCRGWRDAFRSAGQQTAINMLITTAPRLPFKQQVLESVSVAILLDVLFLK